VLFRSIVIEESEGAVSKGLAQLTANEAIKTKRFYFLWLMMFINMTSGIAILAVASPMGVDIAGLTAGAAAFMVGVGGVFNGAGDLVWASISGLHRQNESLYAVFRAADWHLCSSAVYD